MQIFFEVINIFALLDTTFLNFMLRSMISAGGHRMYLY